MESASATLLNDARSTASRVNVAENLKALSRANPKGTKVSCSLLIQSLTCVLDLPTASENLFTQFWAAGATFLNTAKNLPVISSASLAVLIRLIIGPESKSNALSISDQT